MPEFVYIADLGGFISEPIRHKAPLETPMGLQASELCDMLQVRLTRGCGAGMLGRIHTDAQEMPRWNELSLFTMALWQCLHWRGAAEEGAIVDNRMGKPHGQSLCSIPRGKFRA